MWLKSLGRPIHEQEAEGRQSGSSASGHMVSQANGWAAGDRDRLQIQTQASHREICSEVEIHLLAKLPAKICYWFVIE